MVKRRTPGIGPRRTGRPGRRGPTRPRAVVTAAPLVLRGVQRRFTGRSGVLVLVLVVLAVSYASSLRAFLDQRDQIRALKSEIGQRTSNIDALEREQQRWRDPAYVKAQARQRFGFLMPGETSFVVIGEDGQPLDAHRLDDSTAAVPQRVPDAWWTTVWDSVERAGDPPPARSDAIPERHIEPPPGQTG